MATNTANGTTFYYNDIVNPKDIRKTIINIDSRFRNSYADSTSNFAYDIATTIKNVARIKLVSTEIPNTFYTFTLARKNVGFNLILEATGTNYFISIEPGNYSMTQMIAIIQGKLNQINTAMGTNLQFMVNEYNALYTVEDRGSPPANFTLDFGTYSINRPVYWGLGYYLGFRQKLYSGQSEYTAEFVPDLNGDPYVLIDINDYTALRHVSRHTAMTCFAKVIIRENKYFTIFSDDSSFLTKEYTFSQPTNISQFRIRIFDMYGETIDLNDANISMTFEVSEITNSDLYSKYLNYLS
jgi:hypothetical protein